MDQPSNNSGPFGVTLLMRRGRLLLLIVSGLMTLLHLGGCLPSAGGERIVIDGFLLKEIEIENPHFELQQLPYSIQPTFAYWVSSGDPVAMKWDTFEFHFEDQATACPFVDNVSTECCQICDLCNPPPSAIGPPCFGIWPNFSPDAVYVASFPSFVKSDEPKVVLTFEGPPAKVLGACSNNTQPLPEPVFSVDTSGIYQLRGESPRLKPLGENEGEVKLHVVPSDQSLPVLYQLTHETIGQTNYWTWTIEGNPDWLENFSPNLRVSKIRILKGNCTADPTNGRPCAAPTEVAVVKPSRILFMPNFVDFSASEADFVCHDNPNANPSDGYYIDLKNCRTTNDTNPNIVDKRVTPSYLKFGGMNGDARPFDRLTWLVEFNVNEGADPVPVDSILMIEFTIEHQ